MIFPFETFLFFVSPIICLPVSLMIYRLNRRKLNLILFIGLSFAYFAFWAKSEFVGDLERYMDLLPSYRQENLVNSLNLNYDGLLLLNLFFKICSLFSKERYLIAIETFILYSIHTYIMINLAQKYNYSRNREIILLLVFMIVEPFYGHISSLRSSLSFTIFSLGLCFEYINSSKKQVAWILYISSIFIHDGAFALIALRVLLFLPYRIRKRICYIIPLALFILSSGREFVYYIPNVRLQRALDKIVSFSNVGVESKSSWAITMANSMSAKTYIFLVIVMFSIFLYKLLIKGYYFQYKEPIIDYFIMLVFFTIGMMFFSVSLYFRYVKPFLPFYLVFISPYNEKLYKVSINFDNYFFVRIPNNCENNILSLKYIFELVVFGGIIVLGFLLNIHDFNNSVEIVTYIHTIIKGF